jgi:hypothetical protein
MTPTAAGRAALLALLAWWTVRLVPNPHDWNVIGGSFMHQINLPFHEAGHLVFSPLGDFMNVLGGSLFQIIIPLVCAVAFVRQEDWFSTAACAWWAGENFVDLGPYVADARALQLPLIGGQTGSEVYGHDWENILGQLGWLRFDARIGMGFHIVGSIVMIVSLGVCLAALWDGRQAEEA